MQTFSNPFEKGFDLTKIFTKIFYKRVESRAGGGIVEISSLALSLSSRMII